VSGSDGDLKARSQAVLTSRELAGAATSLARAVGFDVAGVAPARATPETRFLREWIARGYAGRMHYLTRRVELRVDPRRVLEGARSVLVVGLAYGSEERAAEPGRGRLARFAGGDDYHELMRDRLRALESGLEALLGTPLRARSYVDTGPVAERVLAAEAGLGWLGKNGMLIHPQLGSYLLLGVMLSDLDLAPDTRQPDRCGRCRACLDACPTRAFEEPRLLDARRCIAYGTIEDPGPIPEELRAAYGDRLFGCDICQEVCPWNRRRGRELPPDPLGLRERLAPRSEWLQPALEWILTLDEEAWRHVTRRTALRRAKYSGLLRNALVAAGNSGDRSLGPLLQRHADGDDPLLAEHARWALRAISEDSSASQPEPQRDPENR
jgi:epoxyqueuosine reductase